MSDQKHTPGPWRLGVRQPTSDKFIYGSGGTEVADCDRRNNFPDENLANARLIAAAPELLAYAECEEAHYVSRLPSNQGGSGNGQSYLEVFDKHGFRKDGRTETVYQFLDRLRRAAIAKAAGGNQ